MPHLTATYSPDDNKLRLYASSRLDADTYNRVKEAGFRWAPKQELFVAPMWTPYRADLLVELCGEIGDEDRGLVERAEERADRFEDYSDKRKQDANRSRLAVSAIADHIPFGQPILIGHHSERRARKDAERIENGMRKAVQMWETSEYWKDRAAAALHHAKYKELPAVRHRRMKGLEADKRSQLRTIEESETLLKQWQAEGLSPEKALHVANYSRLSRCFSLADYPRQPPASQYEGRMGLWSALDGGVITVEQARRIAVRAYTITITHARRWLDHYERRIAYERAMLDEQGGLKAEGFDIQVGGRVLIGGEWLAVLRVNKDSEGRISSVSAAGRYYRVHGSEAIKGYEPPTEATTAAAKKATKLASLVNFPGDGFLEMTAEEWKRKPKDYRIVRTEKATADHGAYRYRIAYVPGGSYKLAQVYITDNKRVEKPAVEAPAEGADTTASLAPVPDMAALQERANRLKPASSNTEAEPFKAMRDTLQTGGVQVVSAPQLFPTPAPLAARMVDLAEIEEGHAVLEPSAGTGNLLKAIREATGGRAVRTAVEINGKLCDRLRIVEAGATVIHADFLQCADLGRFDRIVLNPPFERGQDIEHIMHALRFLKPGGRLVAICANGPRQSALFTQLAAEQGGMFEPLPAGSFAESGTMVNAALLTLNA